MASIQVCNNTMFMNIAMILTAEDGVITLSDSCHTIQFSLFGQESEVSFSHDKDHFMLEGLDRTFG